MSAHISDRHPAFQASHNTLTEHWVSLSPSSRCRKGQTLNPALDAAVRSSPTSMGPKHRWARPPQGMEDKRTVRCCDASLPITGRWKIVVRININYSKYCLNMASNHNKYLHDNTITLGANYSFFDKGHNKGMSFKRRVKSPNFNGWNVAKKSLSKTRKKWPFSSNKKGDDATRNPDGYRSLMSDGSIDDPDGLYSQSLNLKVMVNGLNNENKKLRN